MENPTSRRPIDCIYPEGSSPSTYFLRRMLLRFFMELFLAFMAFLFIDLRRIAMVGFAAFISY